MSETQNLFISNLRRYRKILKLNQIDLAMEINKSANYINSVENGKYFPSPEMIDLICEALGTKVNQMFLPVDAGNEADDCVGQAAGGHDADFFLLKSGGSGVLVCDQGAGKETRTGKETGADKENELKNKKGSAAVDACNSVCRADCKETGLETVDEISETGDDASDFSDKDIPLFDYNEMADKIAVRLNASVAEAVKKEILNIFGNSRDNYSGMHLSAAKEKIKRNKSSENDTEES